MNRCISYAAILFTLALMVSCGDQKQSVPEAEYHAFHGSRGPVCWKIWCDVSEKNPGIYADIVLLDTKSGALTIKLSGDADSITYSSVKTAFASAIQRGDRLSVIVPGESYQACNIYTGEVVETKKDLEYKYPRLRAEGAESVEFYGGVTGILKITGRQNTVFYFDPETQLFYESNFQYYIDSLVNVRRCGLRFEQKGNSFTLKFDTADIIGSAITSGQIYPHGRVCYVTVPAQKVTLLRFPDAGPKELNERLSRITSDVSGEEAHKLSLRVNNNVIAVSFNGQKKFISGYDLEGRQLWRFDPEVLFNASSPEK